MPLSDASKQILRLMMKTKVVSGGELLSFSNLNPQVLAGALRELFDESLIETNSMGFDAKTLADAYFNLNFALISKARMLAS